MGRDTQETVHALWTLILTTRGHGQYYSVQK